MLMVPGTNFVPLQIRYVHLRGAGRLDTIGRRQGAFVEVTISYADRSLGNRFFEIRTVRLAFC